MSMSFRILDHGYNFAVYRNNNFINENILDPGRLTSWLQSMTPDAQVATPREADSITFCYQAPNRKYHGQFHEFYMMQEDVPDDLAGLLSSTSLQKGQAIIAFSGAYHDVAYMQVDGKNPDGTTNEATAISPQLREQIGDLVECRHTGGEKYKPDFTVTLTEEGQADPTTQMVAQVFGMTDALLHYKGGNEFASALAAAKYLESHGVDRQSILSVTAAIAATVPFEPATSDNPAFPDGHMGQLAHKLKAASERYNAPMNWTQVNDAMLLAVHLANRDVAGMMTPNFTASAHNAMLLRVEERPELIWKPGEGTMQDLFKGSNAEISSPKLYQLMIDPNHFFSVQNIPHFYCPRDEAGRPADKTTGSYPPQEEYEKSVKNAERNNKLSIDYFKAKRVGTALTTALSDIIARQEGKDSLLVNEFVHGKLWEKSACISETALTECSEDERILYHALFEGRSQGNVEHLDIDRSPAAAIILASAGIDKLADLYDRVKDKDRMEGVEARDFVRLVQGYIGKDNMQTIASQLARVAEHPAYGNNPDRAARLANVPMMSQPRALGM